MVQPMHTQIMARGEPLTQRFGTFMIRDHPVIKSQPPEAGSVFFILDDLFRRQADPHADRPRPGNRRRIVGLDESPMEGMVRVVDEADGDLACIMGGTIDIVAGTNTDTRRQYSHVAGLVEKIPGARRG